MGTFSTWRKVASVRRASGGISTRMLWQRSFLAVAFEHLLSMVKSLRTSYGQVWQVIEQVCRCLGGPLLIGQGRHQSDSLRGGACWKARLMIDRTSSTLTSCQSD